MSLSPGKCVCVCASASVSQSVSQNVDKSMTVPTSVLYLYLCLSAFPLSLSLPLSLCGWSAQGSATNISQVNPKWATESGAVKQKGSRRCSNDWMNEWTADWASECEESEWMTKCATGWLTDWYAGILEGIYQRTLHSTSSWNAYFFVLNASFHFLSSLIFILPRDSYFATIHPPFVTLLWKVGTLEIFCKIYCNKSMKHPWGVI